MKKLHTTLRITIPGALFLGICAAYLIILINIQITGQDYYTIIKEETHTRYVSIEAARGEIYDRNGLPLVINTEAYNVSLEYGAMPKSKADFNDVILRTVSAVREIGGEDCLTGQNFPFTGFYPDYAPNEEFLNAGSNRTKFEALLARLELPADIGCTELLDFLKFRYGLTDKEGNDSGLYTADEADLLLRIRYDMEYLQFSRVQPYTIAERVDIRTLTYVKELAIGQVLITEEAARTYVYDGYASHILGRIGKIPSERAEEYAALGYSGDAYVGISGAEQVYEEYLRGIDGILAIEEDQYGNILSETVTKEPVAGKDVYLTIDINLQMTAENALCDNIALIRETAAASGDEHNGEDANSGAAVAVDPDTGEVLAIASYPTFSLAKFQEEYAKTSNDPLRPHYNRALFGLYEPGSTFKPGVAAAALNEGVISSNTVIVDRGAYDYYDTYQPRCWIYLRFGYTHGPQNVTQAIQNSCNYFFYEVGRLLGIEKMNEYCRMYGLGVPTGIEFGESTGTLAGPEYSESMGKIWNPGDTLQAAIGQSDNTFTPLQMAVYTATLANGGTRYRTHMLHEVHSFPDGGVVAKSDPEALCQIEFKAGVLATVKNAMKNVVENGSAARIFRNYDLTVGGKTGTAQVGSDRSDNATFIGFAPYEEPKIAVSVVIEQGANGTDAAYTAKAIFDAYIKGQTYVPMADREENHAE